MHPSRADRDMTEMTMAGLNLIQQALTIYDQTLRLAVCNRRFQEMFDLPDALVTPGADFADTIRYLAARGDYGDVGCVDASSPPASRSPARSSRITWNAPARMAARSASRARRCRRGAGSRSIPTSPPPSGRRRCCAPARRSCRTSLLSYSEDLSAANRELEATITALEEAKRQISEAEARTRLTAEMMPAHIAHVGPDRATPIPTGA